LGTTPNLEQLEQAIRILYKGLGEAAFGIAFLSRFGGEIFPLGLLSTEVIKLEASMRSLEALKGLYTFEYMKSRRGTVTKDVIEAITRGVVESLKHPQ
jgi:hypothetical protein